MNMINTDSYKHSEITKSEFSFNFQKNPEFNRKVFLTKKNLAHHNYQRHQRSRQLLLRCSTSCIHAVVFWAAK
jgi:hypothetical protein